jgi:uncharacterized protein (TIGR00255 family)
MSEGRRVRRSMTGFGRADGAHGLAAEVRSVNSRHLEVRVRLPRDLAALEQKARAAASAHFERGQVEVVVRLSAEGELAPRLELDLDAARRYARAARELALDPRVSKAVSAAELLSLPGVARMREPELEAEALASAVLDVIGRACVAAVAMREREGESLSRELGMRLAKVAKLVERARECAGAAVEAVRERFQKRVAALALQVEFDPSRLEQEIVLAIDRMDVTEELVRLASHLDQFRETLEASGAVGRKLEFLLQEIGRETNTLGSKSADAALSHLVVELKTEQEKLREQVLNLE